MAAAMLCFSQSMREPAAVQQMLEQLRHAPVLPAIDLPGAQQGVLANIVTKGDACLAVAIPPAAAQTLQSTQFALILRLDDTQNRRQSEYFKSSWRMFWGTANFLQFLPTTEWVNTEHFITPAAVLTPLAMPAVIVSEHGDAQEQLLLCDPRLHGVIMACHARGLPLPTIGYELPGIYGEVIGECELAWEERRHAVLLPEQRAYADLFTQQGWTILIADEPVVVEDIIIQLAVSSDQ